MLDLLAFSPCPIGTVLFTSRCSHVNIHRSKWSWRLAWKAALSFALMLPSAWGFGQSNLVGVIGIPPDVTAYQIPGVGFVNLNNGNLHIDIPLRTVKDRNGNPVTTSITYDNSIFQTVDVPQSNGNTFPAWAAYPGAFPGGSVPSTNEWISGLRVATTPDYSGSVMWTSRYLNVGNASGYTYSNWQYIDGNGTIHPVAPTLTTAQATLSGAGYGSGFQAGATDGTGYYLVVTNQTSAVVYDMHGNIVPSGSGSKDSNGNIANAYIDKLGRTVGLPLNEFTSTSQTIYVWTGFGVTPTEIGPIAVTVTSKITLPDGRTYSFQYDDAGPPQGTNGQFLSSQQGHYGSLTGITLPTGGQITIVSEALRSWYFPFSVQSVTTPDGTWSFSYSSTSPLITATAPVDPKTGLASQTTCDCPSNATQTLSIYPGAATGTPLRKMVRQYSSPGHPSSITTTLDNGISSLVTYTYPDTCTPRIGTKKEYDYSGSLIRETDASYYTSASDNLALCSQSGSIPTWTGTFLQNGHHIVDIPQSVTVYGPGGCCSSPVAQTNYTYDSTALSTTSAFTGGNSVLGLPMHDDANFGASMRVRGNPTVISRMTLPGTFVTTDTNYYNILGELVQTVDGNGNSTNFDFTDSWRDSSCISSAVFAYPTTLTNAKAQTSKITYDSCDGAVASVRDQNEHQCRS